MKKSQIAGILFGVAMGVLFSVSLGTVGLCWAPVLQDLGMVMFKGLDDHRIKIKVIKASAPPFQSQRF